MIAGAAEGADALQPASDRDRAAARADQVLANMVEAGYIDRRARRRAARAEDAARARPRSGTPGRALFRRLGRRRSCTSFAGADGRDLIVDDHARSAAAGRWPSRRSHETLDARTARSCKASQGGAGGDDAGRRGAGHGRRARLRRQPVQPRHPGAAPARLGLQAVRLSRGARARLAARRPCSSTRRSASAAGSRDDYDGRYQGDDDRWPRRSRSRSTRWRRRCCSAPGSRKRRRDGPAARHHLAAAARRRAGARHQRGNAAGADRGLCAPSPMAATASGPTASPRSATAHGKRALSARGLRAGPRSMSAEHRSAR